MSFAHITPGELKPAALEVRVQITWAKNTHTVVIRLVARTSSHEECAVFGRRFGPFLPPDSATGQSLSCSRSLANGTVVRAVEEITFPPYLTLFRRPLFFGAFCSSQSFRFVSFDFEVIFCACVPRARAIS
jgi:hypothetical protein